MIVLRLVDAYAPQNDRRVVPIAANHPVNIVYCKIFPTGVTDMLPARNLFEYQEAVLIARVEKVWRLRIVRGAHDIALELFSKNPRVATLHARRHCLADKRKRLVAIQSAQLQVLAIQQETVRRESRFAKSDASFIVVDDAATGG